MDVELLERDKEETVVASYRAAERAAPLQLFVRRLLALDPIAEDVELLEMVFRVKRFVTEVREELAVVGVR